MSLDQIERALGPYGVTKENVRAYMVVAAKDSQVVAVHGYTDAASQAQTALDLLQLATSASHGGPSAGPDSPYRLVRIRTRDDEETFLIASGDYVLQAAVRRGV